MAWLEALVEGVGGPCGSGAGNWPGKQPDSHTRALASSAAPSIFLLRWVRLPIFSLVCGQWGIRGADHYGNIAGSAGKKGRPTLPTSDVQTMQTTKALDVGLTLGDAAGIGPEVMLAALDRTRAVQRARIHLFFAEELGAALDPWLTRQPSLPGSAGPGAPGLHLRPLPPGPRAAVPARPPVPGRPSFSSGEQAFRALEAMADAAAAGLLHAMVTGPIAKGMFDHLQPRPPGQTEYIAGRLGVTRFAMMLGGPVLRVVPVTTHVPLRRVADLLTTDGIASAAAAVAGDLRRWFGIAAPRLVVCGLNPHAGEGGRLGDEEARIIAPAVARLRAQGIDAVGPLPADALFHQAMDGQWDAVICMFHDQALGPLKTVHFGEGFNMTCGLPVPRLSPDHGTAWDLAGSGRADPGSAVAALEIALSIAARRAEDEEER